MQRLNTCNLHSTYFNLTAIVHTKITVFRWLLAFKDNSLQLTYQYYSNKKATP
jgi:hypothetical protein